MEKIFKIWIGLLLLTTFAFLLGYLNLGGGFFVFALLVTTFIKGYMVSDHFMSLSEVQLKYRIIPIVWLLAVLFLVAVAYY